MYELSLFTGAGGGLLGTKLLGWKPVGYVEFNDYCQRVIAQRIKDGCLEEAPIFSDIRSFLSEGYAASYTGLVDVITAGFPCQPFSVAGKGEGENDPRNMWPQTIDVIREVRPRFALLENVPGLLNHEYTKRIFGDLAESGYDCRWRVISAAECGAPHIRKRIWILGDSMRERDRVSESRNHDAQMGKNILAPEGWQQSKYAFRGPGKDVSNSRSEGLEGREPQGREGEEYTPIGGSCWWRVEPNVGRVADELADQLDIFGAVAI